MELFTELGSICRHYYNFKTRLDKHWHNQDIIYDFTAQLHRCTELEVVVNH